MRPLFAAGFIMMLLGACATAQRINQVELGMTKAEVIAAIGKPASISAEGGTEYLNYSFSETSDQAYYGITVPYYVRLVDGRVDSYGRMGDFDSTQKTTIKIETDENIKVHNEKATANKDALYTSLIKLNELREAGLITETEFEAEKRELLDQY